MHLSAPALRAGARRAAPLFPGVVPFGLVAGVAAVETGLSATQAVGMSVVVFAGASQLAVFDLLARDAPLFVVVLTATVINLRMVMYSASIAPYFASLRERAAAGCAYLLTDQSYAIAIAEFADRDEGRLSFYLGAAVPLWVVWVASTAAGALLGRGLPPSWGLTFAVPLVFLALLVPAVDDTPKAVAAGVAALVAVAGSGLPMNLGLLGGAVAGVLAGVALEARASAPGEGAGANA